MARQEAAVAGDGSGESDVVIVGESNLPVAIMRQQRNPWLAVDDDDDDEDDEEEFRDKFGTRAGEHDEKTGSDRGGGGGGGGGVGRRRRRRGSRDESEDPATALSVVSEQLWGLQQKLVGTYMAVARARLGRAFPDPVLVATPSPSPSPAREPGKAGGRSGSRKKKATSATAGGGQEAGAGSGQPEDGPDEETRAELVRGALDSLCAAWEHLAEAKTTLDRRSTAVFAGERAGEGAGDSGGDDRSADGSEASSADGGLAAAAAAASRRDERAEKLGPLWKGSLSEALARSGQESGGGSGMSGAGVMSEDLAGAGDANEAAAAAARSAKFHDADGDVLERLAWTRAARRQLESRRAELFELCGDVAHACVSVRARAAGAGAGAGAVTGTGTAAPPAGGNTEAQRSLPGRLQELLSSARPPLELEDLDVCRELHGRVWETLRGGDTSAAKKGRGPNKSRAPAGADGLEEALKATCLSEGGASFGTAAPEVDPRPLAATCVHALAKAGRVPGDPMAWSLCLAAEACYERALVDLDKVGGALDPDAAVAAAVAGAGAISNRLRAGGRLEIRDAVFSGVPEAQARIRKKLGDASNELGKLMAQCAGALVQAPAPAPSVASVGNGDAQPERSSTPGGAPPSPASQAPPRPHPGLGCAVCVACAGRWFRRSLDQFRAIDDARNTALVLCNLASVERLQPRALARLREACPTAALAAGGGRASVGKDGGPAHVRGAAAAVELCGEAHAALGRREEDERTWDHASGELAMAYLCLGVERRQELLAKILRPDARSTAPGRRDGSSATTSVPSQPNVAQVRGVVGPLEQALQIYTDMKNAPQAAACHYQIGQYYSKVLPAYMGPLSGATDSSGAPSSHHGSTNTSAADGGGVASSKGPGPSSALLVAKAWEVGQQAARHFLAARAYFAPFEHGPTSVILALDLCDLYLRLAEMGAGAAGGGVSPATAAAKDPSSSSTAGSEDGQNNVAVPIPSLPGARGLGEMANTGGGGGGGGGGVDHRLRPTLAVRLQCLEGALRTLLDTRSVFSDAGVDLTVGAAPAAPAAGQPHQQRLRRLLESVTGRLPKVLQALVRTSVESESSSPSSGVFKGMYKTSLLAMRGGGEGAEAMLTRLDTEYGALSGEQAANGE